MPIKKITIKSKKSSISSKRNTSSPMILWRKKLEFNLFLQSYLVIKITTIASTNSLNQSLKFYSYVWTIVNIKSGMGFLNLFFTFPKVYKKKSSNISTKYFNKLLVKSTIWMNKSKKLPYFSINLFKLYCIQRSALVLKLFMKTLTLKNSCGL